MVARASEQPDPGHEDSGRAMRLLNWWRVALSAAIVVVASAIRDAFTWAAERYPIEVLLDPRRWPVVGAGLAALLAGAAISTAIAMPGPPRATALVASATSLAWAGVRWLVLRLAAGQLDIDDAPALRGAYGIGLLLYVFALTPWLHLAVWALSGGVTALVLWRLGVNRRKVAWAVGAAWGVQALGVTGVWLARNAYVIVTGFRR